MFCFEDSKILTVIGSITSITSFLPLLDCCEFRLSRYSYDPLLPDKKIKVHGDKAMTKFTQLVRGGPWILI